MMKTLLIVDDEKHICLLYEEEFKDEGYNVLTASNGLEALELIEKHRDIDLVLLDIKMPEMDGLVTITKLKEIHPGLKTVLLTGHGNEKVRQATESLNTVYFEKEEMSKFWGFIRRNLQTLEKHMAAAGMATGGDLEDAADIESHPIKKK